MTDWVPLTLSIQVAGMATLAAAILGIALGSLLASARFPGRNLLDALITVPMVLPPTVLGYYLLVAVGRGSAVGRAYEVAFGGPLVFTKAAAVLAATVSCLPLVVKSARAALEGVDESFVRAALTLGAGPLRRFFAVRLPLAARGIGAGLVLGFARALGDFGVTLMVAGNIPGETQTAPLAIYDAVQANRYAQASTMALWLVLFALATLYSVAHLTRKVPL